VLTQATRVPVLVMPHPESGRALEHAVRDTDTVMAITSHLVGDHSLVSTAVRFTQKGGTVFLTHVEDQIAFDHISDAISKVPQIDTDSAIEALRAQVMKEPRDYIRSCAEVLREKGLTAKVETIVVMGRRLAEYKRLIEEHKIDLLVMHTKNEDQLAMHGMAYPLAVELREIPILMI
jgi:hypothetical protein